ncbi:MAG: TetR/AcrR family transcriptional regulator [Deltaproteobacteria bacterium]|nr:TetR/AcrR family transcriptional regulator [Deltaproteobacteria bacterium]
MLQIEPEPPTLREVNCEARRQRILETARRLITRGGMRALTMRRLAAGARLSVTTLYNLIGGREEIIKALIGDSIDRMNRVLEREAPLEDPLQRCRALITVGTDHVVENKEYFQPLIMALYEAASREDVPRRPISNRATSMYSLAIQEAISQGLLTDVLDPDVLGSQIFHGWETAYMHWGRGIIDEASFRARALYGLYVALLGAAAPHVRPQIEAELRALNLQLAVNPASRVLPEDTAGEHSSSSSIRVS